MLGRHRVGFSALALLLTSLVAGCAADAQGPASNAPGGTVTVTREFHPAGPTTLRIWRTGPEAQPHRVEILRARTGRLLVGQARLLRQSDGTWAVQTSSGAKLVLLTAGQAGSRPAVFTEAQQAWSVRVLRQDIPAATPGIAVEGEPSLDLVLERQP